MRKPMKIVVGVLGVIGRILLCTVFLAAAMGYPVVHRFAACSPGRAAHNSDSAR